LTKMADNTKLAYCINVYVPVTAYSTAQHDTAALNTAQYQYTHVLVTQEINTKHTLDI
jgi:hypothetical protein